MAVKKTKLGAQEMTLLDAARDGRAVEVKRLLAAGVAVDPKDDRRMPRDVTPLMHAAREGHVEVVRHLVAAGARVDARDKHAPGEPAGRTALHYAARRRDEAVARELLAAGAPVNAAGSGGVGTPLDDAIYGEERATLSYADIRRGLHQKGPDAAEREAASKFVRVLLSQGADPNVPDANGNTPLHGAAARGLVEVAAALLDAGADVNSRNSTGWTALARTVNRKHVDVALLLLKRGLDISLTDDSGWTALHWAVPTR